MTDQEKLGVLIGDFGKLDESRKEHIRGLVQKLAELHCAGKFPEEYGANERARVEFSRIYPV